MAQSKYRVGRSSKDYLIIDIEDSLFLAQLSMMGIVKTRSFDKLSALQKWVSSYTRHKDGQIPLRCLSGKDILDTACVSRRYPVTGTENVA